MSTEKWRAEARRKANKSVLNACDLLQYLVGKDWCRLKDISQALDMDQAKAHRLLNTLAIRDFVQYNEETRRYRIGFQFYSIVYHMYRDNLLCAARPHLEQAAGELQETINLGVLSDGKERMSYVFRLDGVLSAVYDDVPLGVSRYVHESACGKCLLAYLPEEEQAPIFKKLKFKRYTKTSIVSEEALREDLRLILTRGYALDEEEIADGVFCVAMPIFDRSGDVIAAVSVSMKGSLSEAKLQKVLIVLKETTARITADVSSEEG